LIANFIVRYNERPEIFFSPCFLVPETTYPRVFALAQQAKANAGRAKAEAALPGKGLFHAAPRLALPQISNFPLSV
jgi:hypothetical protein